MQDSNGKSKRQLSQQAGTNQAEFSADFSLFINTHSSALAPPSYSLHQAADGKALKTILENSTLVEKLKAYELVTKEFSTLEINGNSLNMWMLKPANFDPAKKYPLLLYQYSGPGSQQVANHWLGYNDYWHQMLASEGYIVACVDGRGTGYKGRDFKKGSITFGESVAAEIPRFERYFSNYQRSLGTAKTDPRLYNHQ